MHIIFTLVYIKRRIQRRIQRRRNRDHEINLYNLPRLYRFVSNPVIRYFSSVIKSPIVV